MTGKGKERGQQIHSSFLHNINFSEIGFVVVVVYAIESGQ